MDGVAVGAALVDGRAAWVSEKVCVSLSMMVVVTLAAPAPIATLAVAVLLVGADSATL